MSRRMVDTSTYYTVWLVLSLGGYLTVMLAKPNPTTAYLLAIVMLSFIDALTRV